MFGKNMKAVQAKVLTTGDSNSDHALPNIRNALAYCDLNLNTTYKSSLLHNDAVVRNPLRCTPHRSKGILNSASPTFTPIFQP